MKGICSRLYVRNFRVFPPVQRRMKSYPPTASIAHFSYLSALVALGLLITSANLASASPGKGKGKGNSPDFVPPGLADKGGIPPGHVDKSVPPGHRRAPLEVVVMSAPPALRAERMLPRPSATHVWVPGYWMWESSAYVWMPGAWMAPPEPAAVWVAPRFEKRSGVSVFISGYWRL